MCIERLRIRYDSLVVVQMHPHQWTVLRHPNKELKRVQTFLWSILNASVEDMAEERRRQADVPREPTPFHQRVREPRVKALVGGEEIEDEGGTLRGTGDLRTCQMRHGLYNVTDADIRSTMP